MAKMMKMQDQKTYHKRLFKSQRGEYQGADPTDKSKYLSIKWDFEHGIPITEEKKKFMEDYNKLEAIERL